MKLKKHFNLCEDIATVEELDRQIDTKRETSLCMGMDIELTLSEGMLDELKKSYPTVIDKTVPINQYRGIPFNIGDKTSVDIVWRLDKSPSNY